MFNLYISRRRLWRLITIVGLIDVFCCLLALFWFTILLIIDNDVESWYDSYGRCDDIIDETYAQICTGYRLGIFIGHLCQPLCDNNIGSKSKLELIDCPDPKNHNGKDCVIFGQLQRQETTEGNNSQRRSSTTPVVLKSRVFTLEELLGIDYRKFQETKSKFLNDSIGMMLKDRIIVDTQSVNNYWELISPFDKNDIGTNTTVINNNIWFLVQDNEYVLSKTREMDQIFPRIIGTCGHFYAVEFVPEIVDWSYFVPPVLGFQIRSTKEKIQLALDLMRFLKRFQRSKPKLELCDVKYSHFGYIDPRTREDSPEQVQQLEQERNLVMLDSDMIYSLDTVRLTIEHSSKTISCHNDSDCHFIDCQGICDQSTGKCYLDPDDNDLRRICRNLLFIGNIFPIDFGLNLGLLTEIKEKNKLKKIEKIRKLCFQKSHLQSNETIEIVENILFEMIQSL